MNARPTPDNRHTLLGTTPGTLIDIFEPEVQLAVWQRPADPAIATYLEANRDGLGRGCVRLRRLVMRREPHGARGAAAFIASARRLPSTSLRR